MASVAGRLALRSGRAEFLRPGEDRAFYAVSAELLRDDGLASLVYATARLSSSSLLYRGFSPRNRMCAREPSFISACRGHLVRYDQRS